MPRMHGVAAVGLAMVLGGCAVQREPLAVIEPEYSFTRDGGRIAAAGSATATGPSVEELARSLELDETSLLTPALPRRELVEASDVRPAEPAR